MATATRNPMATITSEALTAFSPDLICMDCQFILVGSSGLIALKAMGSCYLVEKTS
jgi:hypothetical protein